MPAIFGRSVVGVYQFQSAFDTFPASGSWYPLSAYDRSDGENRGREDDPLLGRGGYKNNRDPVASAPSLPTGGGQLIVPVCMREIGFWLRAMLGDPVVTDDDPNFTHVFESGKDSIPYLAQSKFLASGMYRRTRGLIVNTMALSLEKAGGYPRATLGVMLRDEAKNASAPTGTIEPAFTLLRAPASKPYAKYNGSAAAVTAFSFNFSNQLQPNNEFNNSEYPAGFDPDDVQLSASFTIRYTDTAWDDLADAETAGVFNFGWEIDANKSIDFKLPVARIARQPLPINSPGRVTQTYNVTPEQDTDDPALVVTLKNDVAGYPPPP
jgi:hypothetical protein